MNIFATIALMLQSVLSMLGFAQQSPALPPATQTQIVQTAQQAIQTATTQLAGQSNTSSVQAAPPAACAQYASLKQGDTDTTTGGLVSQLQQFLGVAPTTGTYGPRTTLAYQNICVGGNAQPTSIAGMSKYTDSDFGFSFWYPSGWTVISPAGDEPGIGGNLEDCTFKKSYSVNGNEISNGVSIAEYYCPNLSITLRGADGANPVGMDFKYYFDTNTNTWMVTDLSDPPNGSPRTTSAADISNNTMGGLHILAGAARFGANVVIPLSATNFLIVATNNGGGFVDERVFAKTIVATDPSVAAPVSTAQQIATIEAEAAAYGVSGTSGSSDSGTSHLYTNGIVSLTYPSDFTLAQNITPAQKTYTISYMSQGCTGDPVCVYYTGPTISDVESAFFAINSSADRTYEECTTQGSKTTQVAVNGITWEKDSTGDAGLGHRITIDTYRTYYNGACYEAYLSIAWNVGEGNGPDQGQFSALQNELTMMMNSVRFTVADSQPVKHTVAPPVWTTYSGNTEPVSFTYPGSFLLNESENEIDVGPGSYTGLQKNQSTIDPGSISLQMTPSKFFFGATSAQAAMEANMQRMAPSMTSYSTMTLANETAYALMGSSGVPAVIYVAHGDAYFRILLNGPLLPQEYSTFVQSFRFTN